MGKSLKEKVQGLVEKFYPWGQEGFLPGPMPPESGEAERLVHRWIDERTRDFGFAALTLIARVQPVLQEIQPHSPEGPRLFARIDSSSLLKQPPSILEKMVRSWDPEGGKPPSFGFGNFLQEMRDLGRFRIVANFLGDVDLICRGLEAPYGSPQEELSPAQRALKSDFALEHNQLEDTIYLDPVKRSKGERCRKGLFYPRAPHLRHLQIEVQIQTLLQEAWDKKDHFLIYEPRRRGEEIPMQHQTEIFAMSELLYVADLTFERLRRDILAQRSV